MAFFVANFRGKVPLPVFKVKRPERTLCVKLGYGKLMQFGFVEIDGAMFYFWGGFLVVIFAFGRNFWWIFLGKKIGKNFFLFFKRFLLLSRIQGTPWSKILNGVTLQALRRPIFCAYSHFCTIFCFFKTRENYVQMLLIKFIKPERPTSVCCPWS
jgi:hypothetical protein